MFGFLGFIFMVVTLIVLAGVVFVGFLLSIELYPAFEKKVKKILSDKFGLGIEE